MWRANPFTYSLFQNTLQQSLYFFSTFIKIIIFTLFLLLCFSHPTSPTPPSSPTQNHNPCSATTSGPCHRSNSLSLFSLDHSSPFSSVHDHHQAEINSRPDRGKPTLEDRDQPTPRLAQTHAQAEIVE